MVNCTCPRLQDVKDRSRRLTRLFESFDPYAALEGKHCKVWFSSEVSEDGTCSVGHTKSYVKVSLGHGESGRGRTVTIIYAILSRVHVIIGVSS